MNEKPEILVTSYKNSDLDGVASAISYSEFLYKLGQKSLPVVFGKSHQEALYVLERFGVDLPMDGLSIIDEVEKIVIVDVSDPRGLSDRIKPEKVVEIIDHRQIHEAGKFPNAKVHIELVGASATLVAERFRDNDIVPSHNSAVLLYSAIVSHTINFQNNVTTDRDRKIAKWLSDQFVFPPNLVHEMFREKSRFRAPLEEIILGDFAIYEFGKYRLGIGQLEILGVEKFVQKRFDDIQTILKAIKEEKKLNIIFLTCVDVEKAFNTIVSIDKITSEILEEALGVKFQNGIAKTNKIFMRKEIVPLINDIFDKD